MVSEAPATLALALAGFSIDEESEGDEALVLAAPQGAAGSRPREVATGASALVDHAAALASRVLEGWRAPGYDPEPAAEQLASLCFALQSAVGRGRLGEAEERQMWDAACGLWEASLEALRSSPALCAALERMGTDLYALVDDSSDASQECGLYVTCFSRLASAWQAVGQRQRAKWCLERAMRYSQQVREAEAGSGCRASVACRWVLGYFLRLKSSHCPLPSPTSLPLSTLVPPKCHSWRRRWPAKRWLQSARRRWWLPCSRCISRVPKTPRAASSRWVLGPLLA